jgi:hypothetical protein
MVYPASSAAQGEPSIQCRLTLFVRDVRRERFASAGGLSQIELGISDRRLERGARHRLHEPALLDLELLRLKLAFGRERLPFMLEALVTDVRWKMRSVLSRLKPALKLLLFQQLPFHALAHLKLIEAQCVGGTQLVRPAGKPLTQVEIQRILLLLALKLAPVRSDAPRIRGGCRQRKAEEEKGEQMNETAAHVGWPLSTPRYQEGG